MTKTFLVTHDAAVPVGQSGRRVVPVGGVLSSYKARDSVAEFSRR